MGYAPIQGPFQHSENYWTLIKLGDNQTMVGNTNIYSNPISPEDFRKASETKKEMFETIEALLENENNKNIKCDCEFCKNQNNKESGNKSD